ncbi:FKBP-type peptidyl-prolyl cis-trans isomerase [Aporhodopirellula aestuarii]|uniref:Peptidyl-prolyl cis-trans isomerase n=1 Tax=Aporhodopirellula aestuarii TaxID=2950107 RepID=A0ABT0U0D8_9BACT|nr:FKBP-type peptidyl-prolyl cis-trans isomerase [Aporhodopirellula aestuarii]MCM2370015.1 FKBP-type peptidyl-prolyl cis-trans isomerase [Aporhodopirellula aestuarii]
MTTSTHGQDTETTVDDTVGYYLGFSVGQSFAQQGFEADDFTFAGMQQGLTDALTGEAPTLTDEQLAEVQGKIQAILQKRQAAREEEMQKQAVLNLEKSNVWMEQNSKAEGVKDLAQGIQYKVINEGEGGSPSPQDTVRVHYTGKLTNGEVFDSSVARGKPAEFPVNGVIQGWQLALQKMKVGSKWMLYIPPNMAYGERGSGSAIGPNEVLIFEVELLEIL